MIRKFKCSGRKLRAPSEIQNHPTKVACLNNLGNSFLHRSERLGDLADIGERDHGSAAGPSHGYPETLETPPFVGLSVSATLLILMK